MADGNDRNDSLHIKVQVIGFHQRTASCSNTLLRLRSVFCYMVSVMDSVKVLSDECINADLLSNTGPSQFTQGPL